MWTAPEIAELITLLDQPGAGGGGERWLHRELHGPLHEHVDVFDSTPPSRAILLGGWPRSAGILPPPELLDRLNQSLKKMQQAHADAADGPLDTLCLAVGIRQHDWLLACAC